MMAGSTGLEPAASGVTGRRSNQLNYDPAIFRWTVFVRDEPKAMLVGGTRFELVTAGV